MSLVNFETLAIPDDPTQLPALFWSLVKMQPLENTFSIPTGETRSDRTFIRAKSLQISSKALYKFNYDLINKQRLDAKDDRAIISGVVADTIYFADRDNPAILSRDNDSNYFVIAPPVNFVPDRASDGTKLGEHGEHGKDGQDAQGNFVYPHGFFFLIVRKIIVQDTNSEPQDVNLRLEFDGAPGPEGVIGGRGGDGGDGKKGRQAIDGLLWCLSGPGYGGNGGNAGRGGRGGVGASGGMGAHIYVLSDNLETLQKMRFIGLNTEGGKGGKSGRPGPNGNPGKGGPAGSRSTYCDGTPQRKGENGIIPPPKSQPIDGIKGTHGRVIYSLVDSNFIDDLLSK